MLNLHGLTLFIWIVSVLTLSVSDEVKTDGRMLLTSASNVSLIDAFSENDHRTLSSAIQPISESNNSTKTLNGNVDTPSFAGEGGPISFVSTTQRAFSGTFQLANISDNLNVESNLSKEKNDAPNVIKRNSTLSKIVPRKGATEILDVKEENSSVIETSVSNDTKSITEHLTTSSVIHDNVEHVNDDLNNLKSNISNKQLEDALSTTVNSTLQQNLTASTATTVSSLKEHKAKPTVTIAGPNSDKQPFVSPTRLRLGISKKIDYFLPVVITLLALPILSAVIFMVYKQGRDCWDKRHYRRMDFLIDGMYND